MLERQEVKIHKGFSIREIRVNEMVNPIGLDVKRPLFSWLLESEEPDMKQSAVRILVGREPLQGDMWDSGIQKTHCSIGILYEGITLEPETRYEVTVQVWDSHGNTAQSTTFFETGLRNPHIEAWEGAKWIGAPECYVAADVLSVFELESIVQIVEGGCAGLVFGAGDWRLMDESKNEALLSGENYIRYVLDVGTLPARLKIYRVGYAAGDRAETPLYTLPVKDVFTGKELLTEENRYKPHMLTIQVVGNAAVTRLDGCVIDRGTEDKVRGGFKPRQLNPLGSIDVTTFPRLCNAGCYVGADTKAVFGEIHIRNVRKPGKELLSLKEAAGQMLCGEWQQVWNTRRHSIPMLRRDFRVCKKPAKARLYATARGIYECSINGKRVGDEYFAPGASQFDRHLMYQTYDVTDMVTEGVNGISCILASGWWCDSFSFRMHNYNYWGDRMSFLAKLVIAYEDGTRETVVTNDTDWDYYGEGPYRFAGFFNGEQYDARKREIYEKFSLPGYYIEGMQKPELLQPVPMEEQPPMFAGAAPWPALNETEPELVGNYQAPVRERERFTARSMTEPLPGVYIYDLGQEIAGVVSLTFHEKEGQRIVIRYGEMLYPKLPRYGRLQGQMLQANLREASNTDIYICRGGEGETYSPRFTFHGFRYIEISGVTRPPALEEVEGILLSSVEKITGSFVCDNELVNRFVQNVKYSQYSNFISIPTDCPQRNERMGWLGDTHIFCRTAAYQANVKNFYLRNLEAMRDLQTPDGRLPSIAPFGGGFGGFTYESAMILVVWELYQQYGDVSVIEEYYDAMKRWMDSIEEKWLPGIPRLPRQIAWLGDWLAPEPADDNLIYNAFHYRNEKIMEHFARILKKEDEAGRYRHLAERTKDFWNRTFVEKETGRTTKADKTLCDVQGSYVIGLSCGVFAEQYQEKAYARLAEKMEQAGYTLGTGFFGTGPLNSVLSKGGYQEIAGKTMVQTAYPGWLYPVTQGATTIWERWNSFTSEEGFGENNSMNSFNHYSLGSVLSWLYENILGIRRDEEHPGFRQFTLQPEIGTFQYAKGGIDTPHGRIESAWERRAEGIFYRCRIPANTTAKLVIGKECRILGSGAYEFTVRT